MRSRRPPDGAVGDAEVRGSRWPSAVAVCRQQGIQPSVWAAGPQWRDKQCGKQVRSGASLITSNEFTGQGIAGFRLHEQWVHRFTAFHRSGFTGSRVTGYRFTGSQVPQGSQVHRFKGSRFYGPRFGGSVIGRRFGGQKMQRVTAWEPSDYQEIDVEAARRSAGLLCNTRRQWSEGFRFGEMGKSRRLGRGKPIRRRSRRRRPKQFAQFSHVG